MFEKICIPDLLQRLDFTEWSAGVWYNGDYHCFVLRDGAKLDSAGSAKIFDLDALTVLGFLPAYVAHIAEANRESGWDGAVATGAY